MCERDDIEEEEEGRSPKEVEEEDDGPADDEVHCRGIETNNRGE